jgi:transmembrane sensor
MRRRESSQAIDVAASEWAARLDRGPLSAEDELRLSQWLAIDSRRVGALARAQAMLAHSERARALGPSFRPARFAAAAGLTRRRVFWAGGGAVAASATVLATVAFLRDAGTIYVSKKGEVRLAPLNDGSTVTLNTASKIHVQYSKARRSVRLVEGEAFFQVAKDRSRPFVVDAGDLRIRAVGTAFVVRNLRGKPAQVLVTEGRVEVARISAPGVTAVSVGAPAQATATTDPSVAANVKPAPTEGLLAQLAWREGKIAFQGETLEAAAAEFARYSDRRIVIDDPTLARETITGLFAANDPEGFCRSLALSLDAQVTVEGNTILVGRRKS